MLVCTVGIKQNCQYKAKIVKDSKNAPLQFFQLFIPGLCLNYSKCVFTPNYGYELFRTFAFIFYIIYSKKI